jgi:hypothetical protein
MCIAHGVFADATTLELVDQRATSKAMVNNASTSTQHVNRERHAHEH